MALSCSKLFQLNVFGLSISFQPNRTNSRKMRHILTFRTIAKNPSLITILQTAKGSRKKSSVFSGPDTKRGGGGGGPGHQEKRTFFETQKTRRKTFYLRLP